MDKNLYLYYCLNQTNQTVRTSKKTKVKSVNITYIPEHISFRILRNQVIAEGLIVPHAQKYVTFPSTNREVYDFIKELLFPKPNLALALQNVENPSEVIRQISVAIVKRKAFKRKFDDWLHIDTREYTCLR